MITTPTPSPVFYHAMTTAGAKTLAAAGMVVNTIQKGFLSCVAKVYSSMETMKNMIAVGLDRLNKSIGPFAAPAPAASTASTPVEKTTISMSAADTRKFCHELKSKIADNPAGMFRASPSKNFSSVMKQLNTSDEVLSALKNKKIDNIEASYLVKEWLGQTMTNNRFTAEERKMLVTSKDNSEEVRKIFNSKFNTADADACENKDKFLSLLSVMRAYKAFSLSDLDNTKRQHDPSVVGVVGIARTFEFDQKLPLGTPAGIAMLKQERDEALTAFTALLDHCPPGISPKPVSVRAV